ncbi:MAG: oxidoreductase, partial [Proteobacteria bacterium]|nr:oxidoreductase [Pseudomonadota bacterium]
MRALVLNAPRELGFEDTPDAPLEANEVRIATLFSGISAGTELTQYRGTSPFMHRRFDETRRLFVDSDTPSWPYPVRTLGYEEVGEIVEVGGAVT